MAECFTDDPEGLQKCISECKAYLPENEARYDECTERCYEFYCVDDTLELEEAG